MYFACTLEVPPWYFSEVLHKDLLIAVYIPRVVCTLLHIEGSADCTIKIWDLSSARLKGTLTDHDEQVRGLAVSSRNAYMFSVGDDKQVKCWDIEQNKVIHSFRGHLSGVYSVALHPTIDVLFTGGRDCVCKVWDVRSKMQIHELSGHDNTVNSVLARAMDPQHVKKLSLPDGELLNDLVPVQKTIINSIAVNDEGVMATGGDDGSLWFWDWTSGHNLQQTRTMVQPGSLDREAGINALAFDGTGTRLISCEADKTIKIWKQDEIATPEI
ncbi:Protein pleiotropic regulatory locus 1 [Capsicum annuum]|nr:Protein pleiotropic regulatory locus 1 [Capsicum annuum]